MRVSMENDVNILGRMVRRNMDEPKSHAVPFQIDEERPLEIAVAISANDGDGRPDRLDRAQDTRRAEVAEVPDFISARRQRFQRCRQMVVRIGDD